MTEKILQEYGIATSNRILSEIGKRSHDLNGVEITVTRIARGLTYTMKDDGFPPTDLACDNPFADDVLAAKSILDFGCGVGRNLPWIADNTEARYFGVDPNPVMLESFWEVSDTKYEDRVWLAPALDDIPEDTVFDVVVSTFVMQHLGYRSPEGVMNVTDMTQEIMKHTREGTIWFLLEHDREESGWVQRWFDENDIEPDVFIVNYIGQPDLLHRGSDAHLIIWRQDR